MQRFDIKTTKNVELHRKTFKTTQNYKTDQITMNCIDLTFKRWKLLSDVAELQKSLNYNELHRFDVRTIKILSYVAKHSKQRKTTKLIKLQWIALIWSQNEQKTINYKRNQITSNLHRFDMKTIYNVELRRKTFKTTQNYESDHIIMIASIWRQNGQNFWVRWQNYKSNQITMDCIDLTSKRSKKLSYVAKHSKQRKITKLIK